MGEGNVELVTLLGALEVEPPEHHPAVLAGEAKADWLEAILLEKLPHVPPPIVEAAHPAIDLAVEEDRLHVQLEVGMQQGREALRLALELIVDPLHRFQGGAGIRLLHGGVELPLERLYILLLIDHAFQYLPSSADDATRTVGQPIGAIGEAALSEERVGSPTPFR